MREPCRRCGVERDCGEPYDNGMHSSRDLACQRKGRMLALERAKTAEAELAKWREASGLMSAEGPVPTPGDFEAYRVELEAGYRRLREERDAARAELARLTTWHPASEPPDSDRWVLVIPRNGDIDIDMDRYSPGDGRWRFGGNLYWRDFPPGPAMEVKP